MIDISKAFKTLCEPVAEFFQRPGIGFYIPLYQREYSWYEENIEQLMEDICSSVEDLITDDDIILFLGTIILVTEMDTANNIQPQDNRALPSRIDNVIDGQQRISTIALLACLLYQRIHELSKKLPNSPPFDELESEINSKLLTLQDLFSVDIRRGKPMRKPIIVRGSIDKWTFAGSDAESYQSEISSYLAAFIRAVDDNQSGFPSFSKKSRVESNLRLMNKRLNQVENAHEESDAPVFPTAWKILERVSEEHIWSYKRPDLVTMVRNRQTPMTPSEKRLCAITQLFAFAHFLLQRCCFTRIEPVNKEWAFDMFQSLNATGTPLTAIETFKPMVVNRGNAEDGGFKGSQAEKYFKPVDNLLKSKSTAVQKSRLTNEYLTTFALIYDGVKLSSQFSKQRKWLNDKYGGCQDKESREEFTRRMGDLAIYWDKVLGYDPNQSLTLPGTENIQDEDRKLAALCILYLDGANHKMANTILSRFYAQILRDKPEADKEFVGAVKAVTAFFTLWRASLSNTGLDEVYRRLLRTDSGKMSWQGDPGMLTLDNLKAALVKELREKEVGEKDLWLNRARQHLRYDNVRQVCRFALFVTAHDTIPDLESPGLMKMSAPGVSSYLDPSKWVAPDFKSLEHIAPQRRNLTDAAEWDPALYEEDTHQHIGNLTLLPIEINSSASNRKWAGKLVYYKHLAETDPGNLAKLAEEARVNGVDLAQETIDLLRRTTYKHHIGSIIQVSADDKWDKSMVDHRTSRICEILWKRLDGWLF